MKISALVAQFPVSFSIEQNMEAILGILAQSQPGDIVLFPEGSVSGYSHDPAFLEQIDLALLNDALARLNAASQAHQIHLWAGAIIRENGDWCNRAYGFSPNGESLFYDKINLAVHERGVMRAGKKLPVFEHTSAEGVFKVGVQLCREIRFAEQWGWLARQGAQIILHLNNAVDNANQLPVWRSHLVSHAAGNQRFVLSANNAAKAQLSPTIAISPSGHILDEIVSEHPGCIRVHLDLSQVSDWYLSQCRTDIVSISPKG